MKHLIRLLTASIVLASFTSSFAAAREADSVIIKKIVRMNSYITVPYNHTVRDYIDMYTIRHPKMTAKLIGLGDYYLPLFEEIFDRYEMPQELKMMAVIESNLNPVARSKAGATGMWQFMYRTAKHYGLKINSFVDERMDPFESADAAARYLRDAYNEFGDWNLAISAYNCGFGAVRKAIARAGGSREFWDIYPFLPRETRSYVPAFVGAMYGFKYYKDYGIEPEKFVFPSEIDTIEIHRNLHFKQIQELIGVPADTLKLLNPQYTHDIIPGNEGTCILSIPANYSVKIIEHGDSLYKHNSSKYLSASVLQSIKAGGNGESVRYKVKPGDTLSGIALKHNVKVSQLKKWNNLKSSLIKPGQRILIYTR